MVGTFCQPAVPISSFAGEADLIQWTKDGSSPSVREVLMKMYLPNKTGDEAMHTVRLWADECHARPIWKILRYLGECPFLSRGTLDTQCIVAPNIALCLRPLLWRTWLKMSWEAPYKEGAPWNRRELMLQFAADYLWILTVNA